MNGLGGPFVEASHEPSEGRLATALAEHLATLERADALATLRRAGVAAVAVHRFSDLFNEPQVVANDLLIELKHSQWNRLTQSGVLAQFSATPCVVERAAPLLGEHTEEILVNDLGYTPQRVAELRERKIIRTR